jgi:hypothetical protein
MVHKAHISCTTHSVGSIPKGEWGLTVKVNGGRQPRTPTDKPYTVCTNAVLGDWLQQLYKTLLLKMSVCSQCLCYSTLTHQNKADCITQRVSLVLPIEQKFHGFPM